MILLTGATGTVGRLVAERLAGTGPLRLLTRDPHRVTLAGPGIEVARGDFDDPAGLRAALAAYFPLCSSPRTRWRRHRTRTSWRPPERRGCLRW